MRSSLISLALTALLLGGCANGDPTSPPAAPTGATGSAPAPADRAFPLTVTRRGGLVGVDDRAQITADGAAVVTREGQPPVRTSLPPGAMAELRSLLTAPGFGGRAAPSAGAPVCNDGYEYEVVSPSASAFVQDCGTPGDAPVDRAVAIVTTLFTN